jgi:chorismate dehydratase
MKKIKISAVSYLNTKPFVYGILHSELNGKIELSLDMPSLRAAKLSEGSVDIGLVPVAVIPEIREAKIITDFCISASGKVRTVILASHVPLPEIKKIVLDYQSRTSVRLVQILNKNYWRLTPQWEKGEPGYLDRDTDVTTAAVVIGDRVFEAEKKFQYIYDLGEEWQKMTGLDFVFACWVANKFIDPEFITEFNTALLYGQTHLSEVIAENQPLYPDCNLDEYFRENILYHFVNSKKKGLELFLEYNNNPEFK